jgi:hypothetical protein
VTATSTALHPITYAEWVDELVAEVKDNYHQQNLAGQTRETAGVSSRSSEEENYGQTLN